MNCRCPTLGHDGTTRQQNFPPVASEDRWKEMDRSMNSSNGPLAGEIRMGLRENREHVLSIGVRKMSVSIVRGLSPLSGQNILDLTHHFVSQRRGKRLERIRIDQVAARIFEHSRFHIKIPQRTALGISGTSRLKVIRKQHRSLDLVCEFCLIAK